MKKALIFGATGFIGSYLLHDLLGNSEYEQVTAVVRKAPEISHPRLKILLGDFNSLPGLKQDLVADDVFIALGTTTKKTPNQDEYYKIDHDYPILGAKLAKENGAKAVFLVSAVGVSADSSFFYIRTKGETERDIATLGYEHVHIFRPSMLLGSRIEHRPMEKALVRLFSCINLVLVGKLKPYRGIDGKDVAKAMMNAAHTQTEKFKIYEWSEMNALNRKNSF